jgi:serine phosphatase RsbU (regulator of sigma subunit)
MNRSLFSQIPLFSRLSPEEMALFQQHGKLRQYPQGDFIFREGDAAASFWVVISGVIEVIKNWGSGEEKLLHVMEAGDFIGELGVVYQNHARTASARAAEPVKLIEVPLAELERLMMRQSNLALPLMRGSVARFLKTENAAVQDLMEKNTKLAQSLVELKVAQAQLIQQEKLEHELTMARQIQEAFLPRQHITLPGWEMAVHWKPAREVSGDFYDFLPLPDGRTAIVVGDVAGKGMPAALVMAVTRSIMRATIRHGGKAGDLLGQLNDLLVAEMPPKMFVTTFLALLDPDSGVIDFANAGHCLPVCHHTGESFVLNARGMPLGLMPAMTYEEAQVVLDPGDWILFYSDALSEAHDPARQLFGMNRLHAAVCQAGCQEPASDLLTRLLNRYIEFTGLDAEQEDDLTMIVLRRQDR